MSPRIVGLILLIVGFSLHEAARLTVKDLVDFPFVAAPRYYTTKGPYKMRHPAYIGALGMVAGGGMICLGWGGAILALAALPFYADRIIREERIRRGAQRVESIRHRKA